MSRRYKHCDFDVDELFRERRAKACKDAEFEPLLDGNLCQTQKELVFAMFGTRQFISKRFHALQMIQKQGTCVLCNFRQRDDEYRLFAKEQSLQWQKWKQFLYPVVEANEYRIHYKYPDRTIPGGLAGNASSSSVQASIYAAKVFLCLWVVQGGVIYCELQETNETIADNGI